MEPVDRLAAFLADELSADERRSLEAELARDARLRAQLEAMRRADAALAGAAPTALPDGARDRLLAALEPAFDAELEGSERGAGDELAARRRTGSRRTWLTAAGGVAAAVAAVAVLGPTLGGLGGSDDTAMSAGDADTERVESFAADDGGEEMGEAADGGFAPVGPTLLGSGRSLDEEGATQLLAAEEVQAVVAQGLSTDDARALGAAWSGAFGADTSRQRAFEDFSADDATTAEPDAAAEDEDPASEAEDLDREATTESDRTAADEDEDADAALASAPPADLQILGDVDASAREDVSRCLETILDAGGGVVVPALAELVTFGGEPAIAYALVGVAPDGTVSRPEIWVLARESCETRYLRLD